MDLIEEAVGLAGCNCLFRYICCATILVPVIVFPLVGKKIQDVSHKFKLTVNPPDAFFSIWFPITFLFDIAAVYSAYEDRWTSTIWILFAISNLAIGLWPFVFAKGTRKAVNVSIIFELVLLGSNQLMWNQLIKTSGTTTIDILIKNIFAFGQGWFIAATALGLGMILVYTVGLSLKTHTVFFWFTTPIFYGAFLYYNVTHGLGGAMGVASTEAMVVAAFGLGLILGLAIGYSGSSDSILFILIAAVGYAAVLIFTNEPAGENTIGLTVSMVVALIGAAISTIKAGKGKGKTVQAAVGNLVKKFKGVEEHPQYSQESQEMNYFGHRNEGIHEKMM